MAQTKRKSVLVNPGRRRGKAKKTAHRPRRNFGEIVTVALNPGGRTVAKSHKKRSGARRPNRSSKRRTSARRKNPYSMMKAFKHRHRSRRRSNPSGRTTSFLKTALYAIGGAVASKAITQVVLGPKNTGWLGYAANLAAGFALGKAVGMFTKNSQTANAVILGTFIQVVARVLVDQTPFGQQVKNAGFGDYVASTTITPPTLVPGSMYRTVIPGQGPARQIAAPSVPAAIAAAPAGLSGSLFGRSVLGR